MTNVLHVIKKFNFLILFILITLSSYLLLKFALPHFAISKLRPIILKQTGFKLRVEKIAFEPIGLTIHIEGLSLSNKHRIGNIFIDLSIKNILTKRLEVSELKINGIDTQILKDDSGYTIENLKTTKPHKNAINDRPVAWNIVIKKLAINDFKGKFKDGPVLKIKRLTIKDLFTFDSAEKTSFSGNLGLNDSKIEINGFINNYFSSPAGEINFLTKRFDLKNTNYFQPDNLGMIEGKLDTKTNMRFDVNGLNAITNLTLNDFKSFSKDLNTIDYFIHKLNLVDAKISINKKETTFNANEVMFTNLILSITKKKFDSKKKFSRNSKIKLQDFSFYRPHVIDATSKPMTLSAEYNNGGIIKITESYINKEKRLDAQFLNINLLPFSETFEATLGYQIESGKLNLNIQLVTKDHQSKGKAKLVFNQFTIDDEDESGKEIKGETSLPLKTAISLIRNDKGAIELEFDISGDERNPEFGLLPLLRAGLGSLISSKLSSIIATKVATQFLPLLVSSIPFSPGNALILVSGSYKFLTKPRFQNIEFHPHSDQLKEGSKDVITKLKKFLLKKKNLNFVLCPLASINELEKKGGTPIPNKEETLKLASSRIEKIKLEIADTPTIHPQIIFCRPKLVKKKTEVGILEISL